MLALWAGQGADAQRGSRYLTAYAALVGGSFVLSLWRSAAFFTAAVAASERAANAALRRVLCAPTAFFDANPSGRVLNRFSKELGVLDDFLPLTAFDFLQTLLYCAAIVLMVVAVAPWVLLAALPLVAASVTLRNYYMLTARAVKVSATKRQTAPTRQRPPLTLEQPSSTNPRAPLRDFVSRLLSGSSPSRARPASASWPRRSAGCPCCARSAWARC